MKFPLITSIFKKNKKTLQIPDSLLIKKLKKVCETNNFSVYENAVIYHHSQSFFVNLLIVNPSYGIYIFEYKEWSYYDLKGSSITKASNQEASDKNLAFDKTHSFIKQKFNELIHNDGLAIYNFLLMENLNTNEHKHLNKDFKKLLPFDKILFNDSTESEILQKLQNVPKLETNIENIDSLMSNLFVQYLILSEDKSIHMANKEQIDFINSPLDGHKSLQAKAKSGKSNSILLKAILQKLKSKEIKIIIIEPTVLACDILKNKFINFIEKSLIQIDITSIEIITPQALLNRHLKKIRKKELRGEIFIDKSLMKKSFNAADLIICDDADLLKKDFLLYLKHIQKDSNLILVNDIVSPKRDYIFNQTFRDDTNRKILFKESDSINKALDILNTKLQEDKENSILVIGTQDSKNILYEELKYKTDKDIFFDASLHLIDQKQSNIRLCTYSELGAIDANTIILLDICVAPLEQVTYAANLGKEDIYLLFEHECKDIDNLARILI